ncbi:bifunctional methylenetetrahydrofolate dehydrogenase/methenyltetrahydrofolate cyclohydrolase FolD [Sphingomonas sp. DT-204]|uniref:bifunctional methylenetetrahydrofolate dehydrogenase/methenyltetrahydrofolate cyclohydrolase FolD n=1 Tax=Sphingomonas sp. DT-204 TaxID=3396166 RepID=UPI003F1A467E
MTARIIDGKAAAARLRERVSELAASFWTAAGRQAGLAVVLVGDDPASDVYVRSKGKATVAAGMASFEHRLPESTTEDELIALVDALNESEAVDGILVQLPLPAHIRESAVLTRIVPDKDVDGFHPVNAGRLATGLHGFVPCTPLGCLMLLEEELGDLAGLDTVVIGRSNIVGKPMAALLTSRSATVTLAHSRTRDLSGHVKRADIVVAAVGRPRFVKGEWLKPGATVIDVGINRTPEGLVGDVDFDGAASVAGAITPVPGGVGPMTIACLLRNTIVAAHRNAGLVLEDGAI